MTDIDGLSLLSFNKTIIAIEDLKEHLKCQVCNGPPKEAQSMGRCDHFFCEACIAKFQDNSCPLCKIPSLPCERNPDSIISCLVTSCSDLITLLNGGQISVRQQGLEAPESTDHFNNPVSTLDLTQNNSKSDEERLRVMNKGTGKKNPRTKILSNKNNRDTGTSATKANVCVASNKLKREEKSNVASGLLSDKTADTEEKENTPSKLNCSRASSEWKHMPATPVINSEFKIPVVRTPGTPTVNKRNTKGETMLHIACIKGDTARVKELLNDGANPNTKDNAGWAPLHEACSHGFKDVAAALLEHGAVVDVSGNDNGTPLHDAVTSGCTEIICLLRKWGANDQARDLWGRTPRSLADLCKAAEEIHAALDTKRDDSLAATAVAEPLQSRMVLMDIDLNQEYKKKVENVSKLLKVKLVNEFCPDVTHIITNCSTERRVCQRSLKYMMGVVSGKWILSQQWLDACLAVRGQASPEQYEVQGSFTNSDSCAPLRGRMNSFRMNPGLFKGCHIFFCGNISDGCLPKKDLEALIRAGDGISLAREPNPESIDEREQTVPFHSDPDGPLAKCSHYCIYQEGASEPQLKYDMAHVKSLPLSWLLSCIENYSLIDSYK